MDLRLVFWGFNEKTEACVQKAGAENVLGMVADADSLQGKTFFIRNSGGTVWFERKIQAPEEVIEYDFDYLVVFTVAGMQRITERLMGIGVEPGKVISYVFYLQQVRQGLFYELSREMFLVRLLQMMGAREVLDADGFFTAGPRLSRLSGGLGLLPLPRLDACEQRDVVWQPLQRGLYDMVYGSLQEIPEQMLYDVVLFARYTGREEYEQKLRAIQGVSNNVLLFLPVEEKLQQAMRQADWSFYGKAEFVDILNGQLMLLSRKRQHELKIYIVTHKAVQLPPHDDCYVLLQAGRQCGIPLDCPGDDTGEQISAWNPFLNELTAVYWVWKNTHSRFVGFVHYRRYFQQDFRQKTEGILQEAAALQFLQEYDILVAEEWVQNGMTACQLADDLGEALYQQLDQSFHELIGKYQPDYLAAYEQMLSQYGFYRCNMFITRWEIFDAYASWLFSFLPEVLRRNDLSAETGQRKRAVGFFAERMLTVWLLQQNLKIKEWPIQCIAGGQEPGRFYA